MIFDCPDATGMVLHDGLLFDRAPGHVNYAQVQVRRRPARAADVHRQAADARPAQGQRGRWPTRRAGAAFAEQGAARHAGPARPPGRGRGPAAARPALARYRRMIAGALALGYLASIAVGLGGLVAPDRALTEAPDRPADPADGLERPAAAGDAPSAAAALAHRRAAVAGPGRRRPSPRRRRRARLGRRWRSAGLALFGLMQVWALGARARPALAGLFAPAALFGLLDGMGPASNLAVLQLPRGRLAPAFLGYDLGAGGRGRRAGRGWPWRGLWLVWRRWLRPAQATGRGFRGRRLHRSGRVLVCQPTL